MKALMTFLFCLCLLIAGFGMGLSVNVFMARGVPVVNGGGELLLLIVLPACVFIGYDLGRKHKNRRRRRDDEHQDSI